MTFTAFVNKPVAHLALSGRSRGVLPVRLCPVADGWLMTSATLVLRITQFRLFTKQSKMKNSKLFKFL